MLNKNIEKELNLQLNREIESAYIYLAMASAADQMDLPGVVKWLKAQSNEELGHADKFMKYIMDRGGKVDITGFSKPKNNYDSLLNILENALGHEQKVTENINQLMDLAVSEKDHATRSFLNWFVDEQVEEEAMFDDLIAKVKRVGDTGLYWIDKEMGSRE